MNDLLAERLLSKIMNWSIEDVTRERPVIQLLARFKYDQYDQFAPGMKFIESLALWLEQFDTIDERKTAYEFFRDKIIFISYDEMMHYVGMTFPYLIRPILCSHTAKMLNIPEWSLKRIIDSKEYKMLLRKSLFLGLSDGAPIAASRNQTVGTNWIRYII